MFRILIVLSSFFYILGMSAQRGGALSELTPKEIKQKKYEDSMQKMRDEFERDFSTQAYFQQLRSIKLKNDSTLKIYGEIDLSNDKHSLLIKEKKAIIRKIYPDETRYILALGEKNLKTKGEPNDSCWVFKQLNDSISLYSVVPIAGTEYSIYFSKSGNTELIALNEKNLLPIVGDDEELKKLITHKSYIKAIKKYNNKLREKNN